VIYESPRRLKTTLEALNEVVPDRQLVICRELTKLYEETFRGTAAQSIDHFSTARGEFVIIIQGATESNSTIITDKEIRDVLSDLKSQGLSGRSLVDQTVKITKAAKNRVYRLSLEHKQ
jgi:16S rRNA (cytidine1402-2'-O)-methyltransferase